MLVVRSYDMPLLIAKYTGQNWLTEGHPTKEDLTLRSLDRPLLSEVSSISAKKIQLSFNNLVLKYCFAFSLDTLCMQEVVGQYTCSSRIGEILRNTSPPKSTSKHFKSKEIGFESV